MCKLKIRTLQKNSIKMTFFDFEVFIQRFFVDVNKFILIYFAKLQKECCFSTKKFFSTIINVPCHPFFQAEKRYINLYLNLLTYPPIVPNNPIFWYSLQRIRLVAFIKDKYASFPLKQKFVKTLWHGRKRALEKWRRKLHIKISKGFSVEHSHFTDP